MIEEFRLGIITKEQYLRKVEGYETEPERKPKKAKNSKAKSPVANDEPDWDSIDWDHTNLGSDLEGNGLGVDEIDELNDTL